MTTRYSWVLSGDSITAMLTSWAYQYLGAAPSFSTEFLIVPDQLVWRVYYSGNVMAKNLAISGSTLHSSGSSDNPLNSTWLAPVYIDPVPVNKSVVGQGGSTAVSPRKYIFSCTLGSNDNAHAYQYDTVADYAAALALYCQNRRTAGFDYVTLGTLLPRNDGFLTEPNRLEFNAVVSDTAWQASHGIDGVFDFASDATMGDPANCGNATWYEDGVHPTQAGHARLVPFVTSTMNALFAR